MNGANHGRFWIPVGRMLTLLADRVQKGLNRRHSGRRLRLSETLSLGEKRFLAVVQFQQQEFLVGGTGNSIALLAKLDAPAAGSEGHDKGQEAGS